jgi:hypothetical protein
MQAARDELEADFLSENRKDLKAEADGLRRIVDRLEDDMDEDESIQLLEDAVERVERFGRRLEEERQ